MTVPFTGPPLNFAGAVPGGGGGLHGPTHESGGADEISVAGLFGLLATPQTPAAHATTHAETTGQTADDHHPHVHDRAGADHNSATLAELSAKVSDDTLIGTGDPRLSDERTANAIATTGADVNVDASAPPSAGQVLEATGATAAIWQTPAAGVALTSNAPESIDPDDAAAVGVGTEAARDDHQHAIVTAVAGGIAVGDAAAEGYLFVAAVFWVFCFGFSQYSQRLEGQLNTGRNY